MTLSSLARELAAGQMVDAALMEQAFGLMLDGAADPSEAKALLIALHQRGETASDVMAALRAARARQSPCREALPSAIDTCGTGGDGAQTFNVSTAVAIAAAASGVTVVKHGNRAATSRSGSADVLEALHVPLCRTNDEFEAALEKRRFAFLFAPAFHPGFAHVAPIRKTLPHRTVFNLLGPLLNPARVQRQVIGVFSPAVLDLVASCAASLPLRRALIVHGGTDELSLWGEQQHRLVGGGEAGVPSQALFDASPSDVQGGDAAQNAEIIRNVLNGNASEACTALVAVNLAAAWFVADRVVSVKAGFAPAVEFLRSGEAGKFLGSL